MFQERLVSQATLHYTDEGMLWECASGIKLRHDQNIFSTKWKADWKTTIGRKGPDPSPSADAVRLDGATNSCYESWNDWVSAYSERPLFDWRDRFPAIAGVAKNFASALYLIYAAGLWRENMLSGFCGDVIRGR